MKISYCALSIGLAASLTLAGCASQPKLTQEQILSQYAQLDKLESSLKKARKENAELLAPESYAKASSSLNRAMSEARNNRDKTANAEAEKGLLAIETLNRNVASSRELLAEVLQSRDRANTAGAKMLQANEISALDEDLRKTTTLIEKGNIELAKQRRPKLIAGYSALELSVLKQGTQELAKAAITDAKKQDAEKYAPKTFAQAEEEMALAVTILDADRSQITKANQHSEKAKWLAQKSAAITETVKDFDRRDYTMEDIVLWHQQQLAKINEPIGGQLPFNQPHDQVVLGLKAAVNNTMAERNVARNEKLKSEQQLKTQRKDAEAKIAAITFASQEEAEKIRAQYEARLTMTEKERQELVRKDREEYEKFELVQAMFAPNEANVYRQRKNVLVSAHGFQFPSGQSEIQTDNFPLMNKIIQAVKTFPGARIEVTGHTDATGDDATNQVLSEARAEKVARFLVEVGGFSSNQVNSRGFGESKPVASNESSEGRAQNRRVEIAILNE